MSELDTGLSLQALASLQTQTLATVARAKEAEQQLTRNERDVSLKDAEIALIRHKLDLMQSILRLTKDLSTTQKQFADLDEKYRLFASIAIPKVLPKYCTGCVLPRPRQNALSKSLVYSNATATAGKLHIRSVFCEPWSQSQTHDSAFDVIRNGITSNGN